MSNSIEHGIIRKGPQISANQIRKILISASSFQIGLNLRLFPDLPCSIINDEIEKYTIIPYRRNILIYYSILQMYYNTVVFICIIGLSAGGLIKAGEVWHASIRRRV